MSESITSLFQPPSKTLIKFGIRSGSSSCANACRAEIPTFSSCAPGATWAERGSATAALKYARADLVTLFSQSICPTTDPLAPAGISTTTTGEFAPILAVGKSGAEDTFDLTV